jgi:hypothetical protein
MPNWCRNILYVTGHEADALQLRALMTTTDSKFDFNAVLPMPIEVQAASASSDADIAWQLKYGDWVDTEDEYGPTRYSSRDEAEVAARQAIPTFDHLADHAQECLIRFGSRDWYSWAVDNWGTKWNSSYACWMSPARAAQRDAAQVAFFDTAWAPPVPVILALSSRFPNLTLRLSFFEPDLCFEGFLTAVAGDEIASKCADYDCERDYVETVSLTHDLIAAEESMHPSVYIGDARSADFRGPGFQRSIWANPFSKLGYTAEQATDLYRRWLLNDKDAELLLGSDEWTRPSLDAISEQLKGKTLVCDCTCEMCHGVILMRFADGDYGATENTDDDECDSDAC